MVTKSVKTMELPHPMITFVRIHFNNNNNDDDDDDDDDDDNLMVIPCSGSYITHTP